PRTQSLIAALAGLQVPFLCSETHELGEELAASRLYQVHLYHCLRTTTTAASSPTTISRSHANPHPAEAFAVVQGNDRSSLEHHAQIAFRRKGLTRKTVSGYIDPSVMTD